ncbi:Endonuclease/exonuclease/phosphatase [Auriscalpium vulgare]|uniref:Endonuclease/exonuclease/phosphatase n=1 Tax=Auriscalpium vulgare TaxID=40419 RepID=A0ACB8S6Y7_9AGAM|nr:Endonuclease/exonuclease/phosphatase [Auriscalpium vulgare]
MSSDSKTPSDFRPTPEQLALQEARRLKKSKKHAQSVQPSSGAVQQDKGQILPRVWLKVQEPHAGGQRFKLMTWNLLAQCLVRRELFPTSDCLKAGEREHMLYREILFPEADIICLQEVDRLEKLLPVIEKAQYKHIFAAGPRKKHGLLIAYRQEAFELRHEMVVRYDDMDVREAPIESARRGSSFRTKNIASIVALGRVDDPNSGFIVATTHLFWHPRYSYERARQAGILLREVLKFREEHGLSHWPCVLAGDFNFAPDDAGYSLLVGEQLTADQEELLTQSRVVHVSIDPSVPLTAPASADDEGDTDTGKKNAITNARTAQADDGLLSSDELVALFTGVERPRSAYDEGQRLLSTGESNQGVSRCGERLRLPNARRGAFEPEWTSYTHYWKTVLDYIFIIDPADQSSSVLSLLQTPKTDDLAPGLPKKGVSGSDHVSLATELQWK